MQAPTPPSNDHDTRKHWREEVRTVLGSCNSVQELEAVLAACKDVSNGGAVSIGNQSPAGRLAKVLRHAFALRDLDMSNSTWRSILWQIVSQEVQHRRFALFEEAETRTDGTINEEETTADATKKELPAIFPVPKRKQRTRVGSMSPKFSKKKATQPEDLLRAAFRGISRNSKTKFSLRGQLQ